MAATNIINSYSELLSMSSKVEKPLLVLLATENHPSLMEEVIGAIRKESPNAFQLLQIQGQQASNIKFELNILNLPALIILKNGENKAICQGLIAKHELEAILQKLY